MPVARRRNAKGAPNRLTESRHAPDPRALSQELRRGDEGERTVKTIQDRGNRLERGQPVSGQQVVPPTEDAVVKQDDTARANRADHPLYDRRWVSILPISGIEIPQHNPIAHPHRVHSRGCVQTPVRRSKEPLSMGSKRILARAELAAPIPTGHKWKRRMVP